MYIICIVKYMYMYTHTCTCIEKKSPKINACKNTRHHKWLSTFWLLTEVYILAVNRSIQSHNSTVWQGNTCITWGNHIAVDMERLKITSSRHVKRHAPQIPASKKKNKSWIKYDLDYSTSKFSCTLYIIIHHH